MSQQVKPIMVNTLVALEVPSKFELFIKGTDQ